MKRTQLHQAIRRWVALVLVAACVDATCLSVKATNGRARRSPDSVLLVFNANSSISQAIADDYAAKRCVKNILSIQCQDSAVATRNETIRLAAYKQQIEAPIRNYLRTHRGIDFIVLTKGVPIRITGAAMGSCDEHSREPIETRGHPSVDSTL